MRNIVIITLIILFFSGCIFKDYGYRDVKPNKKLSSSNRLISVLAPTSYQQTPFRTLKEEKRQSKKTIINFNRTIPNMMIEKVSIWVYPVRGEPSKIKLLHKNSNKNFESYVKSNVGNLSDWRIYNDWERGVAYRKSYVDFIGGLKCITGVESSSPAAGVGIKHYQTTCYYNNENITKTIHFDYSYISTFNRTTFEGSNNPSLVNHKLQEIELQFKTDMKEIFDSLQIYDMDMQKMEKEGLLYNKKYDVTAESKVPDKGYDCTLFKSTEDNTLYECKGRELDITKICDVVKNVERGGGWTFKCEDKK